MKIESLLMQLACNYRNRAAVTDWKTGQPIIVWRGNGATLRVGAFGGDPSDGANLVTDWTDAVSATLVVRQDNASGTVLVNKTVLAAAFNTTLTYQDWLDGNGHFDFILTGADTNQTTPTSGRLNIYWAIELQTTGPDPITIGTGTGEIVEDGIGNAATPSAADYEAWSKLEADARFGRRGTTAPDLRLDLTALTGGGTTALDGIVTAGINPPYLVGIIAGGALRFYLLSASTAAEAAPGIIRPDDYSPTNQKVWTQVL